MKQISPGSDFSFFVNCVLLSLSVTISVYGQSVSKEKLSKSATTVPASCDIHGTVMDMTPDISEEAFAKFERASLALEEDALAPLEGIIMGCGARSNAVVRLQGDSITRKAITDSKGNFDFWELPAGTYEISTEVPTRPSSAGKKRTAIGKRRITVGLDTDKQVWTQLNVHAYPVAVRGRITAADGRPVAGVRVTATDKIHDQQYLHDYIPRTWTTVSKSDGSYEFQGFIPPDIYSIAGYLSGGDPTEGGYNSNHFYVEIHVEANGFVQDKKNVPKVPLVSEELLVPARRLMEIFIRRAVATGDRSEQEKQEFRERKLPSSQGNTITGIDIVLKKASDVGR